MSKLYMSCLVGAFLLVIGANMTLAYSPPSPLAVLPDLVRNLIRVHDTVMCVMRSCDTSAIYKVYLVDDLAEMELKQRSNVPETGLEMVMKLDAVAAHGLSKLLQEEPECVDVSYTCPYKTYASIPNELWQFVDSLGTVIQSASRLTPANVNEAINAFANSVNYIENSGITSGSSIKRFVAAINLAAKGLKDICDRSAH